MKLPLTLIYQLNQSTHFFFRWWITCSCAHPKADPLQCAIWTPAFTDFLRKWGVDIKTLWSLPNEIGRICESVMQWLKKYFKLWWPKSSVFTGNLINIIDGNCTVNSDYQRDWILSISSVPQGPLAIFRCKNQYPEDQTGFFTVWIDYPDNLFDLNPI